MRGYVSLISINPSDSSKGILILDFRERGYLGIRNEDERGIITIVEKISQSAVC